MRGSSHHVGEHFAEQRLVVFVDFLVARPHLAGGLRLQRGIGVQHALELRGDEAAHARDALQRRPRLDLVDQLHALGDVLGEIADALELGGDLRGRKWSGAGHAPAAGAGPAGAGSSSRPRPGSVDLRIARDNGLGQRQIARGDRLDRIRQHVLGKPAHAREIA